MAESMKGLHRTCRCAEVTKEMTGSSITLMGWGAESPQQRRYRICRPERPLRDHAADL